MLRISHCLTHGTLFAEWLQKRQDHDSVAFDDQGDYHDLFVCH